MRTARQIATGLLIALASVGIILGGLSLSLAEGGANVPMTSPVTSTPTWPPPTPILITDIPAILPTELILTPTFTFTPPPTPINCPPPMGWFAYTIQPGDTLDSLALRTKSTTAAIIQANCLIGTTLFSGNILYLPPLPTATAIPCGAPSNWVIYTVKSGDTLYSISQLYSISVAELQRANCLNTTIIHVGDKLNVPYWPPKTSTPTTTVTATGISTPTPTSTATPTTVTDTPTNTPVPSETPTETISPTSPATP